MRVEKDSIGARYYRLWKVLWNTYVEGIGKFWYKKYKRVNSELIKSITLVKVQGL